MGFVYLLGDSNNENYYKIGVTTGSIDRRIKKLQTGNAGEIYLVDKYETDHPFFIESRLHFKFFKERLVGEWFELTKEDAKNFQKYCKDVDDMIESLKENPFFPKNLK